VAERHFRDRDTALIDDRCQQVMVLRRIDPVVTARQRRDCTAGEAGAMGGLIDTTGQPRHDDEAGVGKIARQLAGEFQSSAGGIARSHDRDHRPHRCLVRAAHAEQGRRIVQRRQSRRVAGFIRCEQADAEPRAGGDLPACVVLAADAPGSRRASASGQLRQPFQRRMRAAEMREQGAKGPRSDIVGPISRSRATLSASESSTVVLKASTRVSSQPHQHGAT
jgi:hypothetical protein